MSVGAVVKDGQIQETASQSSVQKSSGSNGMDKDAFLQLLVAQMKYQDPLEPTSNTEYISQYATFSELEQMQNMSASLELSRASALVGETVLMKITDSTGRTTSVQGNVDYVVYENNKAYLSINGELYSMDDLDTVADKDYLAAYDKATDFVNSLKKLPGINGISLTDAEDIEKLETIYKEMNEYEKSFLAKDVVAELNKYLDKLKELKLAAESGADSTETEEASGETEASEETEASTEEGN